MPTFAYSAAGPRAGETITGERVGDTMDAAVAALRREQVLVTRITPVEGEGGRRRRRSASAQGGAGRRTSPSSPGSSR